MAPKSKARKATRKRSLANPTKLFSHEDPSFTIFNKLPTEIRLMIWKDALPGPRIVHVKMAVLASTEFRHRRVRSDRIIQATSHETWPGEDGYEDYLRGICERDNTTVEEDNGWDTDDDPDPVEEGGDWPKRPWGFRSRCQTPAMLLACRESYSIASKVYSRAFGTKATFPSVWFDFKGDILYLNQETFEDKGGYVRAISEEISQQDLSRVQNFAMGCDDLLAMDYKLWLIPTLAAFGHLKKFTAVLQHYELSLQGNLNQYFESKERTNLIFTESINMSKACDMYQNPEKYYWIRESEISPRLQMPGFDIVTQYRMEWIQMGFNVWEMPDFDQKVVTTSSAIQEMEDLRQKFIKTVSHKKTSIP